MGFGPYTHTLVVKIDDTWNVSDIARHVHLKMGPLAAREADASVVVARTHAGEALVLIHVMDDSSAYGRALSDWLGEMPFEAPFPPGSLLWYR